MKWFYNIPQKLKTALLLTCIVTVALVTSFWENSNVSDMDRSFTSIYKDRLLPANELFHITDLMYQKKLMMIDFKNDQNNSENLKVSIASVNKQIDSILHEYEKTYLIAEESVYLDSFKQKVKEYNGLEQAIINENLTINLKANATLEILFKEIRKELIALSQIQTAVGKELVNDSKQIKAYSSIVHYCQMAVILVMLLIVQAIVFSARSIIPKNKQKFHLN